MSPPISLYVRPRLIRWDIANLFSSIMFSLGVNNRPHSCRACSPDLTTDNSFAKRSQISRLRSSSKYFLLTLTILREYTQMPQDTTLRSTEAQKQERAEKGAMRKKSPLWLTEAGKRERARARTRTWVGVRKRKSSCALVNRSASNRTETEQNGREGTEGEKIGRASIFMHRSPSSRHNVRYTQYNYEQAHTPRGVHPH